MSRPYVRKVAPQRFIQDCTTCEGVGRIIENDWDGEAPQMHIIACCDCDGCGLLSDCVVCDEPTPISVLELFNYRCAGCVAIKELAS